MPLPKNFAILTKPRVDVSKIQQKKYGIEVLLNFPGAWKAIDEKWLEAPNRLKGGGLDLLSDLGEFRHFKVYFNYFRKGIAAKEYTEERAEFEVWQHKNGFSLVVNAPRDLAKLAATFISTAIYKDPFSIRIRSLDRDDFIALVRYVRTRGGKVTVLQLRRVETSDMGVLSVLKISSGQGIKDQDVDRFLNAAKKVTRIGFQIPNLNNEQFKFWVGHWGGGTIYTPSLTEPHHAWSLVKFLL